MGVNKHQPHVLILPEDDANRQIAIGFVQTPSVPVAHRNIQILRPAGGWSAVRAQFVEQYQDSLKQYPHRHMVLLVDFDEQSDRRAAILRSVEDSLTARVFVLGTFSEPEKLKSKTQLSYEKLGERLAQECSAGTTSLWGHELLRHNEFELERLAPSVRPILFPTTTA